MTPSSHTAIATPDPRRQYRVTSALDGTLAVALVLADGTEHPAEMVDVSAGGTCLRCALEKAMVPDIGQQVVLRVQPFVADTPVTLHATIRWLGADESGNIRCGLEFQDFDQLIDRLSPTLWRPFNTRNTRR